MLCIEFICDCCYEKKHNGLSSADTEWYKLEIQAHIGTLC